MINLTRQKCLPFLGPLPIGYVHRHAADARYAALRIDGGGSRTETPAELAIGAAYAKFSFMRARSGRICQCLLKPIPVFRL